MPETHLVETPGVLDWFYQVAVGEDAGDPPGLSELLGAGAAVGYPCFLRSDILSGKHEWGHTCFVPSADVMHHHMFSICESHVMAMMCPPPLAFAVRRLLTPAPGFSAFGLFGSLPLPIGRERRYFVRDGEVECHHGYWPEEAIHDADMIDWPVVLARLNHETSEEVALLTGYAEQLAQCFPGYWSVDFMADAEGEWWFIDAALGEDSWHPECVLDAKEDPFGDQ